MAVTLPKTMPRLVVFGGTFDPVHKGHVAIARCLRDELNASKVLMVPTGQPWLRDEAPVASPQDRLRMVELAVSDEKGIEASDVDVVRRGTTYSLDTLHDLRAIYGDHNEFILAIGSDAASTLHLWHRYDELIDVCTVAVVQRPSAPLPLASPLPADAISIEGPMLDISASQIRHFYATGELTAASDCVPTSAHRFIIEKGLYRCDQTLP